MPLQFDQLIDALVQLFPADLQVYVVGGAVRDKLVGRPVYDLDLVLPAGAAETSRRVADALQAAYYPMDVGRETIRVILDSGSERQQLIDFSVFRGPDLITDLQHRDFTINAMAYEIHRPDLLIDPAGGLADLRERRLRMCAPDAFEQDPLRVLRAVRFATDYELNITRETRKALRMASGGLVRVSPERIRDELFRILSSPHPVTALRVMETLNLLPMVLPELEPLRGLKQTAPHNLDVWNHTLMVIQKLQELLGILDREYRPEQASNLVAAAVSFQLGRYRRQLNAHLHSREQIDRSALSLLYLAALYHDAGKALTYQEDGSGRVRFLEHEQASAKLINQRGRELHLSNSEILRLKTIVRHHMRPIWLAQDKNALSHRTIYRYYRDTGQAGVDIVLHALADVWATSLVDLDPQTWEKQVAVGRDLLQAWWEQAEVSVQPPVLINGDDLIQIMNISPGKLIGRILEAVREAQASGTVTNRTEALSLANKLLELWSEDRPITGG